MTNVSDTGERDTLAKKREAARDSLFLMTVVSAADGREMGKARIRNLSSTGLMADYDRPVHAGDQVSLTLRGVGKVTGTVQWAASNRIGIKFNEIINPHQARHPVSVASAEDAVPAYLRDMDLKKR